MFPTNSRTRRLTGSLGFAAAVVGLAVAAGSLVAIQHARAELARASDVETFATLKVPKADVIQAEDTVCTSSLSRVPMPGMTKTFTLGGNSSSRVLVSFTGAWAGSGQTVPSFVQVAIDDVVEPAAPIVVHQSPDPGTHGFNVLTRPLFPGTHTATVLWFVGSQTKCIRLRSLTLLHR